MMRTFIRHRAYIYTSLLTFEKTFSEYKKFSRSQMKRRLENVNIVAEAEGKWTYIPPHEVEQGPEPDQPGSKRQKIELSPDEVCVICLEKRKTHAFLHANLTKVSFLH